MDGAPFVLFAVPSHTLRDNARRVAPHLPPGAIVISACKGLEQGTFKRMSVVLAEELPDAAPSLCALSGPNLAREIVRGLPSATVVASASAAAAAEAQRLFNSPTFRVYTNADVIGTELGGTLKNVMAIGAAICDGMALGDNAKAAFVTRGLAEMVRLGVAAGAQAATFAGAAGVGDLMATCYSNLSRNYRVGLALMLGAAHLLRRWSRSEDRLRRGSARPPRRWRWRVHSVWTRPSLPPLLASSSMAHRRRTPSWN